MASHFSSLGFDVHSEDDFVALAEQAAESAEEVSVKGGIYLRWAGGAGEELWIQADRKQGIFGMHPHFAGKASMRVGLQDLISRKTDTVLDGAFHGWANPREDSEEMGDFPFLFDLPDARRYDGLKLPVPVTARIAAFAHEVDCFESPEAYAGSQDEDGPQFASQSFIPSGLFKPDDEEDAEPQAMALFTGHVADAARLTNALTGNPYIWALVETLGGSFDVVVDPDLLEKLPAPGSVLHGHFWLSGQLIEYPDPKQGFLGKLLPFR